MHSLHGSLEIGDDDDDITREWRRDGHQTVDPRCESYVAPPSSCANNNANVCPVCSFDLGSQLYRHLKSIHAYTKEQIETLKAEKRRQKLRADGKAVLTCEHCDIFFSNEKTLLHHKRTKHTEDYSKRTINCPLCNKEARVEEKSDIILVEHCFTHCGHKAEPSQLRLDDSSEKYIISLLMEGLTVRQVRERLRTKTREGPRTRLFYTTTRDIRNISAKCLVRPGKLHNLDTVSVQMRVDKNTVTDGIQFFRAAENASGEGFTMVIINPTQQDWLRKYGQRAVCLDDTFNLTSYSLRLATIVVADEFDRALPAAYLLSYRMTEVEVGVMFECVKKLLPSFHTDFFMTDDTNTFWNGFKRVFNASWTDRLLCLWHVQQAMKRNATTKLINTDLLEPFMRKMREICSIRDRQLFTTKYTSLLKYLRDQGEVGLASYLENSWSGRIDQWAAFGRMGSCVSTSMLCERFHKTLKHDIMEGKANVRTDSLMHLLITLTVEKEEEREIMVARGVEEGRYRLQQHHKSHKSAVEKYADQQHRVVVAGNGLWTVEDNGKTYHVKEQYCPCDKKLNNHCLRGTCKACPYAYTCDCIMDVKSGISCLHIHAAATYAASGKRLEISYAGEEMYMAETVGEMYTESAETAAMVTVNNADDSDEEEEMDVMYVMEDEEEENVPPRRRSADLRDQCKDRFQKIEMDFAAGRMDTLSLLNKPDEELLATLEKAEKLQNEYRKLMAEAATRINGKENDVRLARRPDVASNGRPQALTPIRKLHKRSHLRSVQQAKRKLSFEIPDCEAGERDTCAVCLRMQPNNMGSETTISWIECPQCKDWMHTACVGNSCPKDGTVLS